MSSISPIETKAFAKKINAPGCEYIDAPVSGGEVGAKVASLTIMAGGSEAAFERVKTAASQLAMPERGIAEELAGATWR